MVTVSIFHNTLDLLFHKHLDINIWKSDFVMQFIKCFIVTKLDVQFQEVKVLCINTLCDAF